MNLQNKKIGIWGFGVVGKSVFNYVKKFTDYVQILDQKSNPDVTIIIQTPETIKKFLEYNDYIIPSPGIVLLDYQEYQHKFLYELDIFSAKYHGTVIAVTGTAGKTTVTDFIHQSIPKSVAAGNIGLAMLDLISQNPQPETTVLELSSYQLQYAQNFAPDVAVWTNFFENHLDHHKDIDEYFMAKCNILKNQKNNQTAVVNLDLVKKIQEKISYQGKLFGYSKNKPTNSLDTPVFYIEDENLILLEKDEKKIIFHNITKLPQITFVENWITIIAALYLANKDLSKINSINYTLQKHRVEFVQNYKDVAVYNDSKSTIQESTKQALTMFTGKKIALILGGMSKGANREPLIEYISQEKNITPFIFGHEKDILFSFCKKHNVAYFAADTLDELLNVFKQNYSNFEILLFSPAGSSFDQFKNYQDRGQTFKELIKSMK